MGIRDVQAALKITASVDPAVAKTAWEELVKVTQASIDKMRTAQQAGASDWNKSVEESARNVARYMTDSIEAEIKAYERGRLVAIAYSKDVQDLAEKKARGETLAADEAEKYNKALVAQHTLWMQQAKEREATRAKELAFEKAHHEALKEDADRTQKDEKENKEFRRQAIGGAIGFAGNLIAKTAPEGLGVGTTDMLSGIKDIASSKTLWEGMLNGIKAIALVAVDIYNDSKQRTRETIAAAGGTQQFARFLADPTSFQRSKTISAELSTDERFTADERANMPKTLQAYQLSAQSKGDISNAKTKDELAAMANVATLAGQSLTEFVVAVGDAQRRTNQSASEVTAAYARAADLIDEHNKQNPNDMLNSKDFLNQVQAVEKAFKDQRYTVQDATKVTERWKDELDKNIVSAQELRAATTGMRGGDRGAMAYMAPFIMQEFDKMKGVMSEGLKGAEKVKADDSEVKIRALLAQEKTAYGKAGLLRELSDPQNAERFKKLGIDMTPQTRQNLNRMLSVSGQRAVGRKAREHAERGGGSLGEKIEKERQFLETFAPAINAQVSQMPSDVRSKTFGSEGGTLATGALRPEADRLKEIIDNVNSGFRAAAKTAKAAELRPQGAGLGDWIANRTYRKLSAEEEKMKELAKYRGSSPMREKLNRDLRVLTGGKSTDELLEEYRAKRGAGRAGATEPSATNAQQPQMSPQEIRTRVDIFLNGVAQKWLEQPTAVQQQSRQIEQQRQETTSGSSGGAGIPWSDGFKPSP